MQNCSSWWMNISQRSKYFAIVAVDHENVSFGKACKDSGPIMIEAEGGYRALMSRVSMTPSQSLSGIKSQYKAMTGAYCKHVAACCNCTGQSSIYFFLQLLDELKIYNL